MIANQSRQGAPMPTNAKSLLTIEQAAVELDKSPVTVRRYVQTGKLAHYRIGGEVRSTQPTLLRSSRLDGGRPSQPADQEAGWSDDGYHCRRTNAALSGAQEGGR